MIEEQPESPPPSPDRHVRLSLAAEAAAAEAVAAMNLPDEVTAPLEARYLSQSLRRLVRFTREGLEERFGDRVPTLIAISIKSLWFSLWSAATYMRLSAEAGRMSAPALWTAEGYAESDGWAYSLYNELANVTRASALVELVKHPTFLDFPDDSAVLNAIALNWLLQADEFTGGGDHAKAQDCLYEAFEALRLDHGAYMWAEASEHSTEEAQTNAIKLARSAMGKRAAEARHAENRAMKQDVFAWCDANLQSGTSMDSAASQVAGTLVPAAWRTVREWMTEWKKLRSAGTQ